METFVGLRIHDEVLVAWINSPESCSGIKFLLREFRCKINFDLPKIIKITINFDLPTFSKMTINKKQPPKGQLFKQQRYTHLLTHIAIKKQIADKSLYIRYSVMLDKS